MGTANNVFVRGMEIFSAFVVLNITWMICSFPLITSFSSTLALFAVMRDILVNGIQPGYMKQFFIYFKQFLGKGMQLFLFWGIPGILFLADFFLFQTIDFAGKGFLYSVLIFCSLIYLVTSLALFPAMVYQKSNSLPVLLKHALFYGLGKPGYSIPSIFIVAGFAAVVIWYPFFLLISFSMLSFILVYWYRKTYERMMKHI